MAMISVPESIELETTRKMFENPEVIRISEDYTVILRKSERGKKYAEGILRAKNRRNKVWQFLIYGCLCELTDGGQALSLKKSGLCLEESQYKTIDRVLGYVLQIITTWLSVEAPA